MKRKIPFFFFFIVLLSLTHAQNIQLHYDFGRHLYQNQKQNSDNQSGRQTFTSTVEMFKPDKLGSFFFFTDFDYSFQKVYGAYWEVSHEFCFWKQSKAKGLSIHLEYNGGINRMAGAYNDAWLMGLTYSGHSADYTKTWSISAMYKIIPNTISKDQVFALWNPLARQHELYPNTQKKDIHNFQITGVWSIEFAHGWCTFSGFVDFWRESRWFQIPQIEAGTSQFTSGTEYIFLSEPQFWVNFNQIKGWEKINLSLGTEIELSNNFVAKGFYCIPTIALKWDFSK